MNWTGFQSGIGKLAERFKTRCQGIIMFSRKGSVEIKMLANKVTAHVFPHDSYTYEAVSRALRLHEAVRALEFLRSFYIGIKRSMGQYRLRLRMTEFLKRRPIQTPIPNSFSDVASLDCLTPSQVTYSPAHLNYFIVSSRGEF